MVSFPTSGHLHLAKCFQGQVGTKERLVLCLRNSHLLQGCLNPTIMPAERAGVSDASFNLLLRVPIAVLKSICHHTLGLAAIVHSDDVSQTNFQRLIFSLHSQGLSSMLAQQWLDPGQSTSRLVQTVRKGGVRQAT